MIRTMYVSSYSTIKIAYTPEEDNAVLDALEVGQTIGAIIQKKYGDKWYDSKIYTLMKKEDGSVVTVA